MISTTTKPTPATADRMATELRSAMAAQQCRRCGCFQQTVTALRASEVVSATQGPLLHEALALFEAKRYDCLGCEVCWPALAQNLAAEIDPELATGAHCATAAPEVRNGWPPLPGDYQVSRYLAPVAVCTLNSDPLMAALASGGNQFLAIVGALRTENLGIERLMQNILANPHIRFLIVCGEDTRRAIGHLPGQSLLALARHGIDSDMRIINAPGKRPLLRNVTPDQIAAFRRQVQVVDRIGTTDPVVLQAVLAEIAAGDPGPFSATPASASPIPLEVTVATGELVLDPAGYFIVYPDRKQRRLVLEHYLNTGVLHRMFGATTAAALYTRVIAENLISRLDHAAYLGRELARAEQALQGGTSYVQDRAPGKLASTSASCGCGPGANGSCG